MNYAYEQKKRTPGQSGVQSRGGAGGTATEKAIPNSMRLAALESGQASPTAADKGHRVDLPEAMRAKMESSFGMDFSKVKLYESRVLGETGAEAMAQGNEIAFAPGKFDVSSAEGQARLGHELSHVASQARGEAQGNGFLQDSALEARADREGALAARGESAYGGAVAPLSSASPVAMAGPMQAKKPTEEERKAAEAKNKAAEHLDAETTDYYDAETEVADDGDEQLLEVANRMKKEYSDENDQANYNGKYRSSLSNPNTNTMISGLNPARMYNEFFGHGGYFATEKNPKQIEEMYANFMAPHKKRDKPLTEEEQKKINENFDKSMMDLKNIQYNQLKRMEKRYGTLGTQMHPEDFQEKFGDEFEKDAQFIQDVFQMIDNGGGKYFDFENNKQDQEYRKLAKYFEKANNLQMSYKSTKRAYESEPNDQYRLVTFESLGNSEAYGSEEDEAGIQGPSKNKKEFAAYKKDLKQRFKQNGKEDRLFGRFK